MIKKIGFLFVLLSMYLSSVAFSEDAGPEGSIVPELKLYSKVIGAITQGYVDDVEARYLFYKAVTGITESLDPYSIFVEKEKFELMEIDIKGEYGGLGAELTFDQELPAISRIFPGGAAEKSGLLVNDKILKVDDEPVAHKPLPQISSLIRGEIDSEVKLTIWRDDTMEVFDVSVVRSRIEVPAVRDAKMVGKSLGYMKVTNFQENTGEQFDKALDDLINQKAKAIIIDLRNNGGGLLPSAIHMASRFLKRDKKIVSVKSKIAVQRKDHLSTGTDVLSGIEVGILINKGSASASEVFTAAMQYHNRATVIGTKSYGKASVQSVVPLDDVTAMKLTTARYLTPSGATIDGVGVTPDIIVDTEASQDSKDPFLDQALEYFKDYV
jgi:carboxyl-terminal processing protease